MNIEEYKRKIIIDNVTSPVIKECLLYSVHGGKNLRTQVALKVLDNELTKANLRDKTNVCQESLISACFLPEILHIASLILDDCPHMDNDLMRRGKSTVHVKFGFAMAQLSSFILIEIAHKTFRNSIKTLYQHGLISESKLIEFWFQMESFMSDLLGENGLAGGQLYDLCLLKQKEFFNLENYMKMIEFKTCRLFELSFIIPKLLVDCLNQDVKTLEITPYKTTGYHFGCAFQMADDLMDSSEDTRNNNILSYMDERAAIILTKKYLSDFMIAAKTIGFDSQFLINAAKLNFLTEREQ